MFRGLKGLVAGILAGTAVGVLFSPKTGEKIRKTLKNEVDEGGTGLSTIKDTLVEMGKEIGETCKEAYDEVSASDEFKEGKEQLKKAVANAKEEVKRTYKKNVPAKTRKKVKKTVTKAKSAAKKTVKKVVKKAKKAAPKKATPKKSAAKKSTPKKTVAKKPKK